MPLKTALGINIEEAPLKELIENRGFDNFQSGLVSRFNSYEIEYNLVYWEPTSKSAMYLEFENEVHIGRVTVWVSGECEMEVLEVESGITVFQKSCIFKDEGEFHQGYPEVVLFIRDFKNA